MEQKKCVKCGKPKEQGDECPYCGVYYAKAEAAHIKASKAKEQKAEQARKNMLVECKACGKKISKNALACPHCGEPVNQSEETPTKTPTEIRKSAPTGCLVAVGLFIAFAFFSSIFNDAPSSSSTKRKSKARAITGNNCVTKSGYVYGINREYFDKAMDMLINKDNLALAKLQNTGVVGFLKPGVKVYREDVSIMSGAIKIRPEGETVEVWTNIEAVECK